VRTRITRRPAGAGRRTAGGSCRRRSFSSMTRRPAAAGRLTAGGSCRRRNSLSTPLRNSIASGGCITAGGGRSVLTAAVVSGGAAVRTRIIRRPAAAGHLNAGGSCRRCNSPNTPLLNQRDASE